ncbi:hypothetical protein [Aurantibacillus circumpalustris]|uniref:hypothetical protein n=1 Tax=Aurantibacillus circumpalustris TaxID=3036359 RepID=UPI00295B334E|nr:hypothetical protein [Aurantibacillus circumpalustris]
MENSRKMKTLAAIMLLTASMYSQSDSLGMPGDNLDLNAVLSIFKQSASIEDFEKRLNSADNKINNLDLNGDNQVDYLRVVDYGKDDFHSIVIQDPVSKSESQDVAVIEVVKKDNNTAHVQIVGDETLYGKDYIIEPADQAPLNDAASKKNKVANDDVYETDNSSTHVMINVWGWPSVSYLYSPSYSYWVSPWYWGYYPGWYYPWSPYGWRVYHRGFYGYNYGFYGYRRHHYAFPHVHNYYHGKRVSSGYVQKTAPHYGRRNTATHNRANTSRDQGNKESHNRNTQPRNSNSNSSGSDRNSPRNTNNNDNRTRGNKGEKSNTRSQQNTNEKSRNSDHRNSGQNKSQSNNGGTKVNSTPRSGGGGSGKSGGTGGKSGGGRNNGGGGRSGHR